MQKSENRDKSSEGQPVINVRSEGETYVEDSVDGLSDQERDRRKGILGLVKRFGVAGFLFFFIKGVVLYILVPLGLIKWIGC